MAITFQVSNVARATARLRIQAKSTVLTLQKRPVEAMGASSASFLPAEENGLLRAVHMAYALHYPLSLSPDAVWLCIAQGFATHVSENAERLRGKFVRHPGQLKITIARDDFVKGSPENRWPEVFSAFSREIARHIGRQRDLVICDFSTTGPCERAASEIVLLHAMQHYFRYEVETMCGIPEITLEGTVDDWRSVRRRALALAEYELGWWTDALGPVLDRIVDGAEGRVDVPFWETFFKHVDGSGGPWVRGWINVLFPYLRDDPGETLVRNDLMAAWKEGLAADFGGGPSPSSIPSGVSGVPFDWNYFGERFPMQFLGGFVGVAQDADTLALRPAIGWAVRDDVAPPTPAREAHEREATGSVSARLFPHEATLIAGCISEAVSLTPDEIAALVARIGTTLESAAARGGVRLACVVAGNLATVGEFPEVPVLCRIGIGVPVGAVDTASRRFFGVADLRRALHETQALPEGLWHTIDGLLPCRIGHDPALHLVISGMRLRGKIRFGSDETGTMPVTEVNSSNSPAAVLDVSPEAHDARVSAARARGIVPNAGLYSLAARYEGMVDED